MTGSQKALKVICVILVIFAILILLMGGFMIFGATLPGMSGEVIIRDNTMVDAATMAFAVGGLVLVIGLFYLIIGMLGIRGANNPKKIGLFYVLSIVGAIFGVVGLVGVLWHTPLDSVSLSSIAGTVLVVVCAVLAGKIKKLA